MKSRIIFLATLIVSVVSYAQSYQFEIIKEMPLNGKDISFLAYEDDILYTYDDSSYQVFSMDTAGVYIDSLSLAFEVNGIDVHNDTLFVQKKDMTTARTKIYKVDFSIGAVWDSIVCKPGLLIDHKGCYAEAGLCVSDNYLINYYYAGWSSAVFLLDNNGNYLSHLLRGSVTDLAFINNKTFCILQGYEINKNGRYQELAIMNNRINYSSIIEFPIKGAKGITYINDSVLFVISKRENKLYKLEKQRTVTNETIQKFTGSFSIEEVLVPYFSEQNATDTLNYKLKIEPSHLSAYDIQFCLNAPIQDTLRAIVLSDSSFVIPGQYYDLSSASYLYVYGNGGFSNDSLFVTYNVSADTSVMSTIKGIREVEMGMPISTSSSSSISVFPNPSSSTLRINLNNGDEIKTVTLMDLEGKEVRRFERPCNRIDVSDVRSGTYLLCVSTKGRTYTEKVLVE